MIKLFRIETFKLFKRTKTWVILIAFVLLTALMAYGSYQDAKRSKMYKSPEYRLANMEESLKYLELDKDIIPEDIKNDKAALEDYKKMKQEELESFKAEIAALKAAIEKGDNVDWRQELKEEIKSLEEEQNMSRNTAVDKEYESYRTERLANLKYFLENDIKPEDGSVFNANRFLMQLTQIIGQIFLAMGIAVFAADMVSGEATPPTMKLLLTQPISRAKVLFSKFLSINISSVICILGVELLGFLVVGAIFGFGDPSYPISVGTQYKFDTTQMLESGAYPLVRVVGSSYMIPAWQYLIRLLFLQALFIVACTSVVFLISTVVKTSMVSMGISVVSIVASMIIFLAFGVLKKFARFVFVLFGDVGGLLTGDAAATFGNPDVTLGNTIVMFIVWIVISYVISHIVFTKKDILI